MFDAPRDATNIQTKPLNGDAFRSLPLVPLPEIRRATVLSAFRVRPALSDLTGQITHAGEIEGLIEEICGGRWRIGKRTARALALIFANSAPARVLEFGSGASTVIFAALAKYSGRDAHVVSVDENPQYAAKTRIWLEEFGLTAFATIVTAPVVRRSFGDWRGHAYQLDPRAMDALLGDVPASMLFIDGPASWMTSRADCRFGTLFTAREWLADTTIFVADDVFRAREEAILRRWDQLSDVHVHGLIPVGRGLGVGEISHVNGVEAGAVPHRGARH